MIFHNLRSHLKIMMRKTAVLVTRRGIGRSGELHNLFHDDWPRFPNDAPRCFDDLNNDETGDRCSLCAHD